jgi:hypothetical protein
MRPTLLAPLAILLAGCPDEPSSDNPPKLWLVLDGSELEVRLSPAEPVRPF